MEATEMAEATAMPTEEPPPAMIPMTGASKTTHRGSHGSWLLGGFVFALLAGSVVYLRRYRARAD